MQKRMREEIGKEKRPGTRHLIDAAAHAPGARARRRSRSPRWWPRASRAAERHERQEALRKQLLEQLGPEVDNGRGRARPSRTCFRMPCASTCSIRASASTAARLRTIRPLSAEVGLLPRTHGSAPVQPRRDPGAQRSSPWARPPTSRRSRAERRLAKRYMHHYNFPPYSTGEVEPDARPAPPRDRARRAGRAGHRGRAARREQLPVYHPRRLRGAVLQRLHLDGQHLRLHAWRCSTPACPSRRRWRASPWA